MYKKLDVLFGVTVQNLHPENEEDILFRVQRGREFLRMFFANPAFNAEDWDEWKRMLCYALSGASLAESVLKAAILSVTSEEVAGELEARNNVYREYKDDPEASFWMKEFRLIP